MLGVRLLRRLHRPAKPLLFTNNKYPLFVHDRGPPTVRALTVGVYGGLGYMVWRLLMVKMGGIMWTLQAVFTLGLVRLCTKTNNSGRLFLSEMSLLPDGKTVEIRNCAFFGPQTSRVSISDIQASVKLAPKGHYLMFETKQGEEFVLSAQGFVADKEVLKAVLSGENIDLQSNLIDI